MTTKPCLQPWRCGASPRRRESDAPDRKTSGGDVGRLTRRSKSLARTAVSQPWLCQGQRQRHSQTEPCSRDLLLAGAKLSCAVAEGGGAADRPIVGPTSAQRPAHSAHIRPLKAVAARHRERKRGPQPIWGSRGRRFKSCQPDRLGPDLFTQVRPRFHAGSDSRSAAARVTQRQPYAA